MAVSHTGKDKVGSDDAATTRRLRGELSYEPSVYISHVFGQVAQCRISSAAHRPSLRYTDIMKVI